MNLRKILMILQINTAKQIKYKFIKSIGQVRHDSYYLNNRVKIWARLLNVARE